MEDVDVNALITALLNLISGGSSTSYNPNGA